MMPVGRFFAGEGIRKRMAAAAVGAASAGAKSAKFTPERKAEQVSTTSSEEARRAYNREYMRLWRKRNQERYRIYNREYQRKRHFERKVARILNAPPEERNLCAYGCGRAAAETIERIDPRTWKTVKVPYCGNC